MRTPNASKTVIRNSSTLAKVTAPRGSAAVKFMELINQLVEVHGLQSRPELNGRRGRVVAYDADKGRCGVQLPGSEKVFALRPVNLTALETAAPDARGDDGTLDEAQQLLSAGQALDAKVAAGRDGGR